MSSHDDSRRHHDLPRQGEAILLGSRLDDIEREQAKQKERDEQHRQHDERFKDRQIWLNLMLVVLGLAGLFATAVNLWITKSASDAALLNAQAAQSAVSQAERANDLSRSGAQQALGTVRLERRAWVAPTQGTVTIRQGEKIAVSMPLANSGPTPALNVRLQARMVLLKPSAPIEFRYPEPSPERPTFVIAPSAATNVNLATNPVLGSPELLPQDVVTGAVRIIVFGYVLYKDIFQNDRATPFCFVLRPNAQRFQDSVLGHCMSYNYTD